jgi:hypothetical protein
MGVPPVRFSAPPAARGTCTSTPKAGLSNDEIAQDVRKFLHDHIESVVQLEVLLLLHANPAADFAAADVARELRIDGAYADAQLVNLTVRGMLRPIGAAAYRYAPGTPELDASIAGLARAYADRRVSVIGLVYSKPPPTDPVRSFADAFRLRKEKGDG